MTAHPLLGECLGTAVLIIFGDGVVANATLKKTYGEGANILAITTSWFIGVMMGIFVAQSLGSIQADINPAVTLAKTFLGLYSIHQMWQIMLVQLIGAAIGALFVWLTYLPHWPLTKDGDAIRNCFCTTPAIRNIPANMLSEIIGTIVLVIGVGAIFGHATLGHPVDGLGPYLVGMLVWGIGLALGGATGYAINPARDLGPRIMYAILPIKHKTTADWSYAWVPVVSPFIGALIAAIFWKLLF
jgi:glycerol uptake facilitator protein